VCGALVNRMSMTDSCFIDDTSSKNYVPYVASLATSSSCCVCRPSLHTGTDEYVGLVVCVVSNK